MEEKYKTTESENQSPESEEQTAASYEYTPTESKPEPTVIENTASGIVGALLFSLVGGILYFIIYQFGFIAGIAGYVGVICAVKGYEIFAKKISVKGVVISVIASVAVIIIAEFLSLSFACVTDFREIYEDPSISIFDSANIIAQMLSSPEFPDLRLEVLKETGIALLLCAIASFTSIKNVTKSAKLNK